MKVFTGGSKSIKALDDQAKKTIDELISENAEILIGDCRGADKLIQEHLASQRYGNVTVYATDGKVRNNAGNWPVINVPSNGKTGYEYYQLKDIRMAEDADGAIMIWDGKSRGTLFNIERMHALDKKVSVYKLFEEFPPQTGGVFWLIDDELLAVPFDKDKYPGALAKSGSTYNHKKLWDFVKPKGCSKPFDYYPRGRVVISKSGKVIIYMNPNIGDKYISDIQAVFGIEYAEIKYDFSEHYKCHLDR